MAYVAGEVAPAMKPNYVLRSWREGGQNVGELRIATARSLELTHPPPQARGSTRR
eukprot:COSAG04_NODE_19810_length_407_cov_1.327922_1_plen_54_part_01